mgnify:FL=1
MKIRLEGTKEEITNFSNKIQFNYLPNGEPIVKIRSISKFYPNDRNDYLNSNSLWRVYIELN